MTKDRPPWLPDEPLPPPLTASPAPPPPAVSEGQPAHAVRAQAGAAQPNAAIKPPQVSQILLAFTLCTASVCHHQTMLSGYKHILLCCSQHKQGRIVVYGALLLASLLTFI